jgi:hypothetical protein
MNSSLPSQAVADLLSPYAPEVRNLALAVRAFVLKTIPGLIEQVDSKARMVAYSYGPKYADMVCVIMPTKTGVNLGIACGCEGPAQSRKCSRDRATSQDRGKTKKIKMREPGIGVTVQVDPLTLFLSRWRQGTLLL